MITEQDLRILEEIQAINGIGPVAAYRVAQELGEDESEVQERCDYLYQENFLQVKRSNGTRYFGPTHKTYALLKGSGLYQCACGKMFTSMQGLGVHRAKSSDPTCDQDPVGEIIPPDEEEGKSTNAGAAAKAIIEEDEERAAAEQVAKDLFDAQEPDSDGDEEEPEVPLEVVFSDEAEELEVDHDDFRGHAELQDEVRWLRARNLELRQQVQDNGMITVQEIIRRAEELVEEWDACVRILITVDHTKIEYERDAA